MKADLKELEKQNEKLRMQDCALRKQYDKVCLCSTEKFGYFRQLLRLTNSEVISGTH